MRIRTGHLGLDRFSGLYVLAAIIVTFSLLEPDVFPTWFNVRLILASESIAGLMALAIVLPLAAETLDLSFVGTMTLSVTVSGWLAVRGVPVEGIVAGTMGVALLAGLTNSLLVVHFGVPALIATLGTGTVTPALAAWLANSQDITGSYPKAFSDFGQFSLFSIPAPVYYLFAVAVALYYVLEHTSIGRQVRATGGSPEAAKLAGVNVSRVTVVTLTSAAVIAGFAGLVLSANLGSGPLNAGAPYFASSFAAVLLGSTQIQPGRINVWGAMIAMFMLATGVKGLQLLVPNSAWLSDLFNGAGLLVAVVLALRRGNLKKRRLGRLRRRARSTTPAPPTDGQARWTDDAASHPDIAMVTTASVDR
jgi:ribose transport system permease protein